MKKVFPLRVPPKADARVVEAIKHDVRKYVKRERGKTLPEGFTEWEFDCRVGTSAAVAAPTTLKEIGAAIDAVATAENTEIYIELLARAAHRAPRPERPASSAAASTAPLDAPSAE